MPWPLGRGNQIIQKGFEFAFRHSRLTPSAKIATLEDEKSILEIGVTKYLRKHRVKMQLNANYLAIARDYTLKNAGNKWGILTQFELGI